MANVDECPGALRQPPGWLLRLAAGLEAAAPAALCVLFWFGLHSHLVREPWWSKFNVAAAPFFGDRVFYLGLGRATIAGAALLFLLYSGLGILYAFLAGARGVFRAFLLAVLWLTCWHLLSQRFVWSSLDPAAAPYFPLSATAPAHAAAAILLARFPAVLQRVRSLVPVRAAAPALGEAVPEREPDNTAGGESQVEAGQPNEGRSAPPAPDC